MRTTANANDTTTNADAITQSINQSINRSSSSSSSSSRCRAVAARRCDVRVRAVGRSVGRSVGRVYSPRIVDRRRSSSIVVVDGTSRVRPVSCKTKPNPQPVVRPSRAIGRDRSSTRARSPIADRRSPIDDGAIDRPRRAIDIVIDGDGARSTSISISLTTSMGEGDRRRWARRARA